VPTDAAPRYTPRDSRNFALRACAWSLGLVGLMRLQWVETHLVLPLAGWQALVAEHSLGAAVQRVAVNLSCSGTDAMALCVGVIAAYPAAWRFRLGGAAGGAALVLALNVVRIGTLARAVGWPVLFEALHLYVWPTVLMLAIAAYVFAWMRVADRARPHAVGAARDTPDRPLTTRRFVIVAGTLLVLFTLASPLYIDSAGVLTLAGLTASAAAGALRATGTEATATANVLSTAHGAYLVTQECLSTPLIPLYLAAVLTHPGRWSRRLLLVSASVPLFLALAIARLLVVALPAAVVGSATFAVHAFYQLLLAAVLVALAAAWRHPHRATAWHRAALGIALGGATGYLLSGACGGRCSVAVFTAMPLPDPQGALAFLPAFQVGLYIALSVAALAPSLWRAFLAGLAVLALSQIVVLTALQFIATHVQFTLPVRDVRAWAIASPVLVVVALLSYGRPRR